MAIELGAQHARRVDVFCRPYWEAYPPKAVAEQVEFFDFLAGHLRDGRHAPDGEGWKSAWERGLPGPAIVESEMDELERSVAFLKDV
jgi:hypothetical protein